MQGWKEKRRVVIIRRKISNNNVVGIELIGKDEKQLALLDADNINAYEYSVLVTNQQDIDLLALFHHYRDRADCENNFDELKTNGAGVVTPVTMSKAAD